MARKRGRSYLRGLPCRVGSFFATLMSIAVEEPHRPSTFREDDRIPGCPHVAFLGRSCATRSPLCAKVCSTAGGEPLHHAFFGLPHLPGCQALAAFSRVCFYAGC